MADGNSSRAGKCSIAPASAILRRAWVRVLSTKYGLTDINVSFPLAAKLPPEHFELRKSHEDELLKNRLPLILD